MNEILSNIAHNFGLLFGTMIGGAALGGLMSGIDRKMTARLQGRKGPPLLQPFYDLFKLMGKKQIMASKLQAIWMISYLMLMFLCLLFFVLGQDILVLMFVFGFAGVSLALGGFSTKSPYSHFGANRELVQILAYEPILLLMAFGVFVKNGSFLIAKIYESSEPLLFSLWPIFLALVVILTIKLRKSPFDISTSHHAHQEVVKGVMTEYSGPYYGLYILAEWFEIVILLGLISLFWANPAWIGWLIAFGIFLLELVVDNIAARMTMGWMLRFSWIVGLILCISNIAYLYIMKGVF